jgi:hypothetical protein
LPTPTSRSTNGGAGAAVVGGAVARGAVVWGTVVGGAVVVGRNVVVVDEVVDAVVVVARGFTVLVVSACFDEPPHAVSATTSASAPKHAGIRAGIRSVA